MRTDVPTCAAGDAVGDVRARLDGGDWEECVVVNPQRVVIGLLDAERLGADGRLPAELAMRLAPSTFRPSLPVRELAEYMRSKRLRSVLATTADGELLGVARREDVEREAAS